MYVIILKQFIIQIFRLYSNATIGRAIWYTNDVSKLQSSEDDILENIFYYRITKGYQVNYFKLKILKENIYGYIQLLKEKQ